MKKILSGIFGICGILYGTHSMGEVMCCPEEQQCGDVCCPISGCNDEGNSCRQTCPSGFSLKSHSSPYDDGYYCCNGYTEALHYINGSVQIINSSADCKDFCESVRDYCESCTENGGYHCGEDSSSEYCRWGEDSLGYGWCCKDGYEPTPTGCEEVTGYFCSAKGGYTTTKKECFDIYCSLMYGWCDDYADYNEGYFYALDSGYNFDTCILNGNCSENQYVDYNSCSAGFYSGKMNMDYPTWHPGGACCSGYGFCGYFYIDSYGGGQRITCRSVIYEGYTDCVHPDGSAACTSTDGVDRCGYGYFCTGEDGPRYATPYGCSVGYQCTYPDGHVGYVEPPGWESHCNYYWLIDDSGDYYSYKSDGYAYVVQISTGYVFDTTTGYNLGVMREACDILHYYCEVNDSGAVGSSSCQSWSSAGSACKAAGYYSGY